MAATETLNKPVTAPQYSESQLGFQRLLLRDHRGESQKGEGLKRAGMNASILLGATAADLLEGNVVDLIFRTKMEKALDKKVETFSEANEKYQGEAQKEKVKADFEKLSDATKTLGHEANKLKDVALKQQGIAGMLDFAEEWASDSAYAAVANTWVRLMTGVDGVKYVSETSAFISDWTNAISQVFYGDQYFPKKFAPKEEGTGKIKVDKFLKFFNKSYRTMDFVNPVNIEAAIRLIEETPVIGDGAAWLHEKTDKLIESTIGSWGNTLASKGILGYHIGMNVKSI